VKPVMQSRFGDGDGNCLMACVASILEVGLEDLPDLDEAGDEWHRALRDGVKAHRWECTWIHNTRSRTDRVAPYRYAIAGGPSPRSDGKLDHPGHAVVCLDGVVVHDPFPCGTGLAGPIDTWYILIPPAGAVPPQENPGAPQA